MSQKLSRNASNNKTKFTTEWIQRKQDADPAYRAGRTARSTLSKWFRSALIADYADESVPKSKRMSALFGVPSDEIYVHLLSSTDENVNVFNYGNTFEIDHIRPVSSYQNPLDAFTLENVRLSRKESNRPGRLAALKRGV